MGDETRFVNNTTLKFGQLQKMQSLNTRIPQAQGEVFSWKKLVLPRWSLQKVQLSKRSTPWEGKIF